MSVGLVEIMAYPAGGSTPAHVDCVPGIVVVVSLGVEATFEYRIPEEECSIVRLQAGDVAKFAGDAAAGIVHEVREVGERVPGWPCLLFSNENISSVISYPLFLSGKCNPQEQIFLIWR